MEGVGEELLRNVLGRAFVDFGQFVDDQRQVGRFVAAAAVRSGSQVGRIGFDDYALKRHGSVEHSRQGRLFECQNAPDA